MVLIYNSAIMVITVINQITINDNMIIIITITIIVINNNTNSCTTSQLLVYISHAHVESPAQLTPYGCC